MINESQQEQASLYVVGALDEIERQAFEAELHASADLREFVRDMKHATVLLARLVPQHQPPSQLREKILQQISAEAAPTDTKLKPLGEILSGLRFVNAADERGWKALPVAGAWIKLLSLDRERGYAVLLGKLGPGVRYPAHRHVAPEDLIVLSGDLHVSDHRLGPGDFHHADAGSQHGVNYSVEGCTLLAVLDVANPLVELAMA
jgi:anti-sigma factor ChrR (cupin superfamily)